MSTLLLRLAGPMQSWGTSDRFSVRFTEREPSKSGVVGLLCAALGRRRGDPVDDLAALRMGVRVDAEGTLERDFQTAGGTHRRGEVYGVLRASGDISRNAVPSSRYYLADADFLVGLEGDEALLADIEQALQRPLYQLYLGRKSFVPGVPVALPAPGGIRGGALDAAIAAEPWPRSGLRVATPDKRPDLLRVVVDRAPSAGGEARMDRPAGAAFRDRTFAPRYVATRFLSLGTEVPVRSGDVPVTSDP